MIKCITIELSIWILKKMLNHSFPFLAFLTVSIGFCSLVVAYTQMKIACAKTRLDLYERRFGIYVSALNCYQACSKEQSEEILRCQYELIKSCRESQFLFKRNDSIHKILSEMLDYTNQIGSYVSRVKKYESLNSAYLEIELKRYKKLTDDAKAVFQKKLFELEDKIKPYIQFENIQGWTFF
ncbi:unnamed protein product [Commensalibacter communis]|uniref:Uncharacterized protein n=2 Tax=Commensalibacter communis TaxID=2972786 RepID=A0A9W4TMN6_9PROT|nr:unnamed protein product [Commensalibacter communis]CAI3953372.1 unnamed protein product [Commensalibacter communis]CAI3953711.1 unnamed protein product [Commensalibacter communis]CAI3953779.1 unnamed protein product [Commensalibacter communis]CAI3955986.1 unnamed protein product [Commensalibacter communis]